MKRNLQHGLLCLLLLGCALAVGGCKAQKVSASAGDTPSAKVEQGDVELRFPTTGVLNATQSRIVVAPPVAGGTLRIIQLSPTGSAVKAGDVVVAFDPAQQEYNLAQSRSDLEEAEQEILKAQADASVQAAQDKTALIKAKYAVRRAELDVSKNELLSEIDAKKNLLALEEAQRALAQLQQDIQSHTSSNQAGLALSTEKRNKAQLAMRQAEQNIQNMKVKAAISGMMVVHGNESAAGGMFYGGMTLPDYQVGDQASPGNTIAEVIDTGKMEITSKVSEKDRPYLKKDQSVEVEMDALPGEKVKGRIASVAGDTGQGWFMDNLQRKFDVTIQLEREDARLRPGFSTKVTFVGERIPGALTIPMEAVFEHGGKTIVYAKQGSSWESQDVKVRAYSEGRAILISGLTAGTQVALVNPEDHGVGKGKSGGADGPSVKAAAQ
jgi:HlyD family secretion protein